MEILKKTSQYLIPIIIGIGIVGSANGLKITSYLIFIISSSVYFVVTIISNKRNIVTDVLSLVLVFISLIEIFNLILCLIYPPIIEAVDCEGHRVQSTGYFFPSLINSIITSIILGFLLFRREKKIDQLDRILISIIATVMLISLLFPKINDKYDEWKRKIEKPEIKLPKGC